MTYIITDIYQSGVGPLAPSFTPIRQTGCEEMNGYLALNTNVDPGLLQDQLEVKVLIRDRRGNRSPPVNLTLSFGRESSEKPPEQWDKAASNFVGAVQVDLVSSQSFHGGAGS